MDYGLWIYHDNSWYIYLSIYRSIFLSICLQLQLHRQVDESLISPMEVAQLGGKNPTIIPVTSQWSL